MLAPTEPTWLILQEVLAIASTSLKHAMDLTRRLAIVNQTGFIGPEHQLFGLFECHDRVMADIASEYWISGELLWRPFRESLEGMPIMICNKPPMNPVAKEIAATAAERARNDGRQIECVDILLGIAERPNLNASKVLAEYGVDFDELRSYLSRRLHRP